MYLSSSPILFAAEGKPHLAGVGLRRDVERQLRWAGVTLLVVGWYLYFVVAPAVRTLGAVRHDDRRRRCCSSRSTRPSSSGSCGGRTRLGRPAGGCSTARSPSRACRCSYRPLDALEALEWFALPDGAKTDLLWAIRRSSCCWRSASRRTCRGRSTARRANGRLDWGWTPCASGAFLVGSAFSFPLVHFTVHAGCRSISGCDDQRSLVVGELAALGALAVAAFVHLERQRAEAERRRIALEERVQRARTLEAVSRVAGVVAGSTAPCSRAWTPSSIAPSTAWPGDPLRVDVARSAEHVHRAVEFTNGLRAISRQERGRPVVVDLRAAVSDLVLELRRAIGPLVLFDNVRAPETCATVIDPAHLRVILLDLASNAGDAMPNGGRCRIETGIVELGGDDAMALAVRPGRYARLTVRDSGSGIPKEVLPHLFEPFFSTKPGEEGSGMGLATLYAIVSQYGRVRHRDERAGRHRVRDPPAVAAIALPCLARARRHPGAARRRAPPQPELRRVAVRPRGLRLPDRNPRGARHRLRRPDAARAPPLTGEDLGRSVPTSARSDSRIPSPETSP